MISALRRCSLAQLGSVQGFPSAGAVIALQRAYLGSELGRSPFLLDWLSAGDIEEKVSPFFFFSFNFYTSARYDCVISSITYFYTILSTR